jgi:hypothetical protein
MSISNDTAARRWALHNEKKEKKTDGRGSTVSYDGPVLYSYRTAIARYHDKAVLVSSHNYGPTTSHHAVMARRFAGLPVFTVPDISGSKHQENIEHLRTELTDTMDRAVRYYKNRDGWESWLMHSITAAHEHVMDYCKAFAVKPAVKVKPLDTILREVVADRDAKWAAWIDPKAIEKRERAAARREAKQALGLNNEAA